MPKPEQLKLSDSKGSARFAAKYQPQPFEGGRQVERMGSSLPQLVWTIFLVVRWQKSTEHVERHRNDSATILDLTFSSLRFV